MSSGFRRAKNIHQRTTIAAYRSIWVLFVVSCTIVSCFLKHFLFKLQVATCIRLNAVYTVPIHTIAFESGVLRWRTRRIWRKQWIKMTYSKKQKITENNEKHSNRPVGRCSGLLVDIFGSMEPWTHALSKGLLGLSLNLNILRSKIEICAQNSAFLRKKGPHIT